MEERPKKCIYKYKHDHIYIYIDSMFEIVGLFEGIRGGGRRKENDRK
jgi:hypothetical protein